MEPISLLAHLANVALSLFMWLIIGQLALRLLTGGRKTFFSELFRLGTAPVIAPLRRITPREIGDGHVAVFALLLIIALRIWLLPWLTG